MDVDGVGVAASEVSALGSTSLWSCSILSSSQDMHAASFHPRALRPCMKYTRYARGDAWRQTHRTKGLFGLPISAGNEASSTAVYQSSTNTTAVIDYEYQLEEM